MSVPDVSELQSLNKIQIPGNPNPSTRWRWMTTGAAGIDGERIKLQCWFVANRPFTTAASVAAFLDECTKAQEVKAARRSARSADVSRKEMEAVGL